MHEMMKFAFRRKDNRAETNATSSEGRQRVRKYWITSQGTKWWNSRSAEKTTGPKQTQRVRKADNVSLNKGNASGWAVQGHDEEPFVMWKLTAGRSATNATCCATTKGSRAPRVFLIWSTATGLCHHSSYCDLLVNDAPGFEAISCFRFWGRRLFTCWTNTLFH
jgi:hypothetical protein